MKSVLFLTPIAFLLSCSTINNKNTNNNDVLDSLFNTLYEKNQFEKLYKITDSIIQLNPNNEVALAYRGFSNYNFNDYGKALNDLNKAFDNGYDNEYLRGIRGTVHSINKNYEHALDDFNTFSKMGHTAYMVSRNRGVIYENLGECQKAIEDYRYLMKYNDSMLIRYGSMAGDCFETVQLYDSSVFYYSKALEPGLDPNILNRRGIVYNKLKENNKAIADYNKALNILDNENDLQYWVILSNKSMTQLDAGLLDSALVSINHAIKLCEHPDESLIPNKVSILRRMGQLKQALKLLESLPSEYREENSDIIDELKRSLKDTR